jgi:CHAD domain-containing protein
MSNVKWIDGLKPSMPLAEAAHHVLSIRLGSIARDLPLAIEKADEDIEHVHHLRVGTRRARAALDTFATCLPRREYRKAKKWLRAIRRAAGAARDWDVFLDILRELEPKASARAAAGVHFLFGYACTRRQLAQSELCRLGERRFLTAEEMTKRVLAAIRKPKDRAFRKLRDLALPRLSEALEELHESADGKLTAYENLHQVRIKGKRLRYAMEIFGSCFAPAFREEMYPAIEEMQDILGRANDSHVAIGHIDRTMKRLAAARVHGRKTMMPGMDYVKRFHERRLPRERRNFEAWWKRWENSGGEAAICDLVRDA